MKQFLCILFSSTALFAAVPYGVHFSCSEPKEYLRVHSEMKQLFAREGVRPEWVKEERLSDGKMQFGLSTPEQDTDTLTPYIDRAAGPSPVTQHHFNGKLG